MRPQSISVNIILTNPVYTTRCYVTQFIYLWKTALHVSGGISTHHQKHTQLYLQYMVLVKPLLLPAAIAAGSSNGLTNTRCCRFSCAPDDGWGVHPKHVEQFTEINKLCNVASCWLYFGKSCSPIVGSNKFFVSGGNK